MSAPARYPLAWPAHRPRTKYDQRRRGTFEAGGKKVTVHSALARLEEQVTRLGGQYPLLSTNLQVRMTGALDATGRPMDPGVCLYFELKRRPYAMACDTFTEVAQNIAAIANHIDATRRIEAYGVATAEETLQAFAALPAPSVINLEPPWWDVLGLSPNGAPTAEQINTAYRSMVRGAAGDEAKIKTINVARDRALTELQK